MPQGGDAPQGASRGIAAQIGGMTKNGRNLQNMAGPVATLQPDQDLLEPLCLMKRKEHRSLEGDGIELPAQYRHILHLLQSWQ